MEAEGDERRGLARQPGQEPTRRQTPETQTLRGHDPVRVLEPAGTQVGDSDLEDRVGDIQAGI